MTLDRTGPESASSTEADTVVRVELERSAPSPPAGAERADAARNRLRILEAAERLFAARGIAGVTMDDIAAEAGVGKGTLYRRFGDKGGLAVALLDERERTLQEQILRGPAPLGPGAAPDVRLDAFVRAYLELVITQSDLVLLSETSGPGARLRTGANAFWRTHVRLLLTEAGAPDPALRAHLVLASLAAEQVAFWLADEKRDPDAVADAVSAAALTLLRD